jgi:TolA-binding protein
MTALLALALALASVPAPAAPAGKAGVAEDAARDAAADAKRDELIADLEAILPRMSETDRRADLEFQLAELWWEKARYASLGEGHAQDQASAKWVEEGRKGEEPKADAAASEGYRKRALAIYQRILDRYPRYERRDEVLFVSAHNLYESGSREQGVARFRELVERHPQSRFVPDAYVQMGEHYFAANDLPHARAAFEKAAASRLPKIYPFALYKLAWCEYNAGAWAAAVAKFQEVISYAEGESRGDRVQLRSEALRDIVLAYVRLDVVEDAVQYLSAKAGERRIEAVERLASTYFDSGKFERSIRVYRILEEQAPGHERAPAWQQRVLLAFDKLDRRDQVASEMKRLVSRYGPQSGWAKENAGKKAAVAEASDLTESALRQLVQDYHQEAIKTKSAATYRLARDIYRQYLDTFPHAEASVSMRFYFAEILYALEEWDAAAAEYGKVLEEAPQGEYAQRAAYDSILALEKSVDIARGRLKKRELADAAKIDERKEKPRVDDRRGVRLQSASREVQEEELPANERSLVEACDRYARLVPGGKDEIVVRYKAAFLLYERRHFVDAARRFGEIILRWPTDAWSQKAANLSLDILDTREEWAELHEMGERFLANQSLCPKGSKFEGEVSRIAEGAKFKSLMRIYQEKKDLPLAAKEFRAFVARYPKSEHAPKALYNALVIADQADRLDLEIAAGEQLLRDYPGADSEILGRTMPALGSACERAGRLTEAIRWYEQGQQRWPEDAKAADWLYEATLLRENLGDDAGALEGWQKYLRLYRSRPDAARIAFNVGLILERRKDPRGAAGHWASFQRDWSRAATPGQLFLARYHQALALRSLGAPEAAAVLAGVPARLAALPQAVRSSAEIIDASAHARFLAVAPAFEEFQGIRFRSGRQAELVAALKTKNARLTRLLAAYGEVVAIGSPRWSEAAFSRIGEAYRDFNKGLLDAPLPRGLDAEQQDLYRNTLSAQALPLEDKAVEAFRKAIEVSQKSGVYSEWVIRAQDFLREYQPESFGEPQKPAWADGGLFRPVAPALAAREAK